VGELRVVLALWSHSFAHDSSMDTGIYMAFKAFMRILIKRDSSGMNEKLPDAKWCKKPARGLRIY